MLDQAYLPGLRLRRRDPDTGGHYQELEDGDDEDRWVLKYFPGPSALCIIDRLLNSSDLASLVCISRINYLRHYHTNVFVLRKVFILLLYFRVFSSYPYSVTFCCEIL